ncbi:catalase-peroxidase [Striga asiatica]|uniref:Catalase-peroxidase n=1 Tax=Striga asiatica TaxID=4170 RepID=A0A5A7QK09_STRAF|nr:catalase-peroxidase [Striga asiatica]
MVSQAKNRSRHGREKNVHELIFLGNGHEPSRKWLGNQEIGRVRVVLNNIPNTFINTGRKITNQEVPVYVEVLIPVEIERKPIAYSHTTYVEARFSGPREQIDVGCAVVYLFPEVELALFFFQSLKYLGGGRSGKKATLIHIIYCPFFLALVNGHVLLGVLGTFDGDGRIRVKSFENPFTKSEFCNNVVGRTVVWLPSNTEDCALKSFLVRL